MWNLYLGSFTRTRDKKLRCVGTNFTRIESAWKACEYWTSQKLDCLDCGACCGAAFDVVEVSRQDPVRKRQPDWIVKRDGRYQMKRRPTILVQPYKQT